MAEQSWPHPDGPITDTQQWRAAARLWRGTGVVPHVADQLDVEPVPEELQIRVRAGEAWVDGHFYRNTEADEFDVATADLSQPRMDRLVLEYRDQRDPPDTAGAQVVVLTGSPVAMPQPPALTQEDGLYQLPLFRFRVPAAAGEIDPGDIVDERVWSQPLSVVFVDSPAERDAIPEDSRTVVWRRDVERFEAWDRENEQWVPGPPEHQHRLTDLEDVSAPDPADGEVLAWVDGEQRWEPRPGFRFLERVIFTSSDTFVKASWPGLRAVDVQCQGGGSGATGAVATGSGQVSLGHGGGSGWYARRWLLADELGSSETVTVGAGGAGGTGADHFDSAFDGGATSFGVLVVAPGSFGAFGSISAGSDVAIVSNNSSGPGSPGNGPGAGDLIVRGSTGEFGLRINAATSGGGGAVAGTGADSRFGSARSFRGTMFSHDGENAHGFGAGGSAAMNYANQSARSGGAGAPGVVIVDIYV